MLILKILQSKIIDYQYLIFLNKCLESMFNIPVNNISVKTFPKNMWDFCLDFYPNRSIGELKSCLKLLAGLSQRCPFLQQKKNKKFSNAIFPPSPTPSSSSLPPPPPSLSSSSSSSSSTPHHHQHPIIIIIIIIIISKG